MGNHLGAGLSMAAAVGSAGVFINDILNAREDRILSRKLQKYEHLQDVMVEHLNLTQQRVEQLEENLAIAKDVIDRYKNSVVPSWEEGVKGLRAEIAQLTQDKQAAEAQVKTLALELSQAKRAADAQGRDLKDTKLLYNASLRMAQDLKQDGEASEARAQKAQSQMQSQMQTLQQDLARKDRSLETFRLWHAANLSLRCALEMQLLRTDPENPLLQDQALRERVRRAGETAVTMLGNSPDVDPFDMAREVGLTFAVPGRPSGVQVLSELALTEVYMRRLAFLHAEGEDAWKALHKIQMGHGAMTAARDLLKQMEPESALLQATAVQQVQDLAMDEFQRQQQQQRRLQHKGHSAVSSASSAWTVAVAGQHTVRQRAIENLEHLIEGKSPHAL